MTDDYPLKIRSAYLDLKDRLKWLQKDIETMQWGADEEGWLHPSQLENVQKILDSIKVTNDFLLKKRGFKGE